MEELNIPFAELNKKFDIYTVANVLAIEKLAEETKATKKDVKTEFIPESELQQKK